LRNIDFETKREIISLIVDKIWIGKEGDIDIECVVPIRSEKEVERRLGSSYKVELSRSFVPIICRF